MGFEDGSARNVGQAHDQVSPSQKFDYLSGLAKALDANKIDVDFKRELYNLLDKIQNIEEMLRGDPLLADSELLKDLYLLIRAMIQLQQCDGRIYLPMVEFKGNSERIYRKKLKGLGVIRKI